MRIKYRKDGTYTIKERGWSVTGPSWLIIQIMEDCFNMKNCIKILKKNLKSVN